MTSIDQASPVRPGEELDTSALEAYLLAALPDVSGPLVVEQFPSGYSNLTYLLRLGQQELVLRRPPFGAQVKSGHDMNREYRVLSGLNEVYDKAPTPLLYCADEMVIGADFYVMERVRGVILRADPPPKVPAPPHVMKGLATAAIENLAALHALNPEEANLADLGRPAGYVERQINGWIRRYGRAQTEDIPAMDEMMGWLEANILPEAGAVLIHNDYKYDNLVLNPDNLTHVIAVLDWEMCTLGDPLMDLGTTLGYWVEAADPPELKAMFGLTAKEGNLTRREVVSRYEAASGRKIEHALYYYIYGLFKIAVIVQQIALRYQQGHTQDPRFAALPLVVKACARRAVAALEEGRIGA